MNEWTNERMNDKRERHTRQRGKADGTGLSGCYVQYECVLKHATRAIHWERVLILGLGLVCIDVLLTRRWNSAGQTHARALIERQNKYRHQAFYEEML